MNLKIKERENVSILVVILLLTGLFVPAFVQNLVDLGAHKQLIIGTIVNCALFISSVYMKDPKKVVVMSTLPSISSILSGLLFSEITKYSAFMMPFIWIGNLAIIYLGRVFRKKYSYLPSGIMSILIKAIIIYGGFLLLSNVLNYPDKVVKVMQSAMGITQIYTGFCGMMLSFIILKMTEK